MKRMKRIGNRSTAAVLTMLLTLSLIAAGGCRPGENGGADYDETYRSPAVEFTDWEEYKDVKADPSKFMNVSITGSGIDIHANSTGSNYGYRYGPSMFYNSDGSMDAWFASPGAAGLWDYFTYKNSTDGGNIWSNDKVVLEPTADTMDYPSVCDPGVIYFSGYYYIGYTSTVFSGGVANNVFVARAKHPDGPYEKWDGSGWGGSPAPVIYYTDDAAGFGAGEPSFVELNGTLYVYYTWTTPSSQTTRVAIADATDENWPLTLQYKGIAMERETSPNTDSPDVKYVEDYGKFIAITVASRMNPDSGLQFWESNDGFTFYKTNLLKTNVYSCAHNAGLMGRPNGHINLKDPQFLAYAFGGTDNAWGRWNTRLQPFTITLGDAIDDSDAGNENLKLPQERIDRDVWVMGITTRSNQHYERILSAGPFKIELFWFDVAYTNINVEPDEEYYFTDYDTSVIGFDKLNCVPKKVGETYVTAHYKGAKHRFKVTILPDGAPIELENPKLVEFGTALIWPCDGPVKIEKDGTVVMSISSRRDKLQLRSLARFEDRNWMELFNHQGDSARFWDGHSYVYDISYSSSADNVVQIATNGIVTARRPGETVVTVTCGEFSYEVKIMVVE